MVSKAELSLRAVASSASLSMESQRSFFIELKDPLSGSRDKHSDIVAQILDADGPDLFSQCNESDGIAIHAILTDGQAFEFLTVNFCDWRVLRGVGTKQEAVPWTDGHLIYLPWERPPTYLRTLKQVLEVIFDMFLIAYVNGLSAQRSYSHRRAREEVSYLGDTYVPRRSTTFWDEACARAINVLDGFPSRSWTSSHQHGPCGEYGLARSPTSQ